MAAQSNGPPGSDPMLEFLKNQPRALEINPHSPLIKGLLEEVTAGDPDAPELKDTMRTLLDLTLVRSGFNVEDLNSCVTSTAHPLNAPSLTSHCLPPFAFPI